MSDATTRKLVKAYFQDAEPSLFMSSIFLARPENYHNSQSVEIDIIRHGEAVAVVQRDGNGAHMNTFDNVTNKSFIPPVTKEACAIRAMDLISREAGDNPFLDASFQGKLTKRIMRDMPELEKLVRRLIELQASQIMQTGKVDLLGEDATVTYTLDYGMKPSHKITSGTAWNLSGGDPIGDLETACDVIRDDGLQEADEVWMGIDAFNAFVDNAKVRDRFDNRRMELGRIVEARENSVGGKYRGTVDVGNYQLDVWTYNGRYDDAASGTKKKFLDPANVVVRSSTARMDASFGAIPKIEDGNSRLAKFLPRRFSGSNIDLHTSVYTDNASETLTLSVGARPLLIPTALDSFACIATGV